MTRRRRSRAAFGGERQAGTASVARELVGQVDVEGVDAGARQRQAGVRALVAVGQALGDLGDLGVVGAREAEQADLLVAGRGQTALDHLPDAGERALTHRAGDHPGLAETAASGAAAEDLDAHPLVDGLGERDQRLLGVGPLVQVHHGVLGDAPRDARAVGRHPADAPVGQVVDVVELRHVDTTGACQPEQQLVATAGAAVALPALDDVGDLQHRLLAVAEDGGVDELGDGLGVERRVASGDDDRVLVAAVHGAERDAGEVQSREQVGVAELGGEAHAEQVEVAHRTVPVDGELGHGVLAHERLEVGPHGVRALRDGVGALVEDLVQDHDALVGETDLVGIGVHQRPTDGRLVVTPRLDLRVQLAADVLDRLAHPRQQPLEAREHGRPGSLSHATQGTAPATGRQNALDPARTVYQVGRRSGVAAHVDVLQEADGHQGGEHGGAAVRDER